MKRQLLGVALALLMTSGAANAATVPAREPPSGSGDGGAI